MKKESKIYGLGAIVLVVAILFMTNTGGIASTVGDTLSIQGVPGLGAVPLNIPSITLDKTQYNAGDTVKINIQYRANSITQIPNQTPFPAIPSKTKTQGVVTRFKVSIATIPLRDIAIKPILVTATQSAGNQYVYTGTAQYVIPKTGGTISLITISVTTLDANGIAGLTATKTIGRAKTFVVGYTPDVLPIAIK